MPFYLPYRRPVFYLLFSGFILLLVIQFSWLRYSWQLKERDFDDKVRLSLRLFNDIVQKDSPLVKSMHRVWEDSTAIVQVSSTVNYSIDTFFTNNNLTDNIAWGIGKSKGPVFWTSQPAYKAAIDSSKSSVIALCMDKEGSLYMRFFFPGKSTYILTRLLPMLLLSLFSLLLLAFCFIHLSATIRRQVRLAEMKNDFINNMTHELKTPLFTISIASKMLGEQEGITGNEKSKTYLQSIRQETTRLNNLVESVLQTALLKKKQVHFEKKQVDLHEAVNTAVTNFKLVETETQGKIILQLDAALHYIEADQTHIINMLYNLLDNAFKYTNGNPQIIVSTQNKENGILLSIKDNGIGLSNETKELIFERFYRVHTGDLHHVKGYGIGLSYVKSVVEAHRGIISVNSILNKGSEFIIHLPVSNNGRQD